MTGPYIAIILSSVIARFLAPTYALAHKFDTTGINYVFSVWPVRSLSCVKHTPQESPTKIFIYVSLASNISLRLHCHSFHLNLALPLRTDGLGSMDGHSLPTPIQGHIHKQMRMTLAVELFKVGSGTEPVRLGVSHQLQCYSR